MAVRAVVFTTNRALIREKLTRWNNALKNWENRRNNAVRIICIHYARFTSMPGDKMRVSDYVVHAFIQAWDDITNSIKRLNEQKEFYTIFNEHFQQEHSHDRLCDNCSFFQSGAERFIAISESCAKSIEKTATDFQHIVTVNLEWLTIQSK